MKFRKKPVVIEAHQWTGREADIPAFSTWAAHADFDHRPKGKPLPVGHELPLDVISEGNQMWRLEIKTPEGVMTANVGDWIICGVQGEFYPCKESIFAATYEAA